MSAQTKIQWTDRTWNPTRGCSVISPGCTNCYAMKQAHRFSGPGKAYDGLTKLTKAGPQWTGTLRTVDSALLEPLSWREPAKVFVNSMSDLFHEDVPFAFVDKVFVIMALAEKHTFQILTKRPARMLEYMSLHSRSERISVAAGEFEFYKRVKALPNCIQIAQHIRAHWPLPNVWLGVSVEDQPRADQRIPLLLETPAAVRFVSYEPALGPVDFRTKALGYYKAGESFNSNDPRLDWIIVGGESGSGARPFDIRWARSVIQACKGTQTKVFVKQLGAWPYNGDKQSCEASTCTVHDYARLKLKSRKGDFPGEWPSELCMREFPDETQR